MAESWTFHRLKVRLRAREQKKARQTEHTFAAYELAQACATSRKRDQIRLQLEAHDFAHLQNAVFPQALKRFLLIFSERIFDSSVDRGMPNCAAAPVGPNTRPRLSFRAASIMSFS